MKDVLDNNIKRSFYVDEFKPRTFASPFHRCEPWSVLDVEVRCWVDCWAFFWTRFKSKTEEVCFALPTRQTLYQTYTMFLRHRQVVDMLSSWRNASLLASRFSHGLLFKASRLRIGVVCKWRVLSYDNAMFTLSGTGGCATHMPGVKLKVTELSNTQPRMMHAWKSVELVINLLRCWTYWRGRHALTYVGVREAKTYLLVVEPQAQNVHVTDQGHSSCCKNHS